MLVKVTIQLSPVPMNEVFKHSDEYSKTLPPVTSLDFQSMITAGVAKQ